MTMLGKVTKGKQIAPHLLLLYGPDGIGKSTFGAGAPSPVFLGPEKGTMNLDVARFPSPNSWSDVIQAVDELGSSNHDFKTLVVDTLDWLEPLVYEKVCKDYSVNSIEKAAGGYGKGYREAFNHMVDFRERLSFLRENKGMNIILLAHSKVTTFEDPATEQGYNRYELKLQDANSVSIRSMWREYVDAVLFCNFQTFSKGEGKQARGISTRERKIWTERDAAFDAKNRFGLPFEMNLDWNEYNSAVRGLEQPTEAPESVRQRILTTVKTANLAEDLAKKVTDSAEKATTTVQLYKIEKRLQTKIGELHG